MARNHRDYRRIYEEHYLVKIPKGYHIHHIDGNHENNDPLNLECLSPADHAQKHEHMRNFVSVSKLASEKGGRIQGAKNKESGHWEKIMSLGNSTESIKKRNQKCKVLGIGFYSDLVKRKRSELGKRLKEEKRGIFSNASKAKVKEMFDNGTHPLLQITSEQHSEIKLKYFQNLRENLPEVMKEKQQLYAKNGRMSRMYIWHVENKDGRILEIINLTEFCKNNELSAGTLRMTSTGAREWHKGWKCKQLRKITKEEFDGYYNKN